MKKIFVGDLLETESVKILFGNKNSSIENLKSEFPDLEFFRMKQTHSDILVEASSATIEADAHYTSQSNKALVINTADCLPVLVHLPSSKTILGIHAGWRGIESNIIGKSLQHLKSKGHEISDAKVWIGPHIGYQSFEVGFDVAERLKSAYRSLASVLPGDLEQPQPDPAKKRINLFLIATAQLVTTGVNEQNISAFLIDTVKSSEHESFRRDGAKSSRQLSFISLRN